jgi:exo-1,4-beta-D-glucosaminidase
VRTPGATPVLLLALAGLVTSRCASSPASDAVANPRLSLDGAWRFAASVDVGDDGAALSLPGLDLEGWLGVTVPGTVVGGLVESGVLPDPFPGQRFAELPGTSLALVANFGPLPYPPDSPYPVPWWFRREFQVPAERLGDHAWLSLDGVNYRADVWLNGQRVATDDQVAGTYRRFVLDVSDALAPQGPNVLALRITPQMAEDLGHSFVDWNPMPPDKGSGPWQSVSVAFTGPVVLRHPYVSSDLALPGLETARLTATVEAENATDGEVSVTVRLRLEDAVLERQVTLGPREKAPVTFVPDDSPALTLQAPRVWWPAGFGAPELYEAAFEAEVDGEPSDGVGITFGVRTIQSELDADGHRLFRVNGQPILIRGAGWAPDLLLRQDADLDLAQVTYARHMGLNTLRLEGWLANDHLLDLCDRNGLLVLAGWCCCSQWEMWSRWDDEDHRVGPLSLKDQALRFRSHPSTLAWMYGSDKAPPPEVEQRYLDALDEAGWSLPALSSATAFVTSVTGATGVKMTGPYDWVPPTFWTEDTEHGGAFGFNTETGPGPAIPVAESLARFVPADELWPPGETWLFHTGGGAFHSLDVFEAALAGRLGPPTGLDDYLRKAQLLAYEGVRAQFEAFGQRKFRATGVVFWMLNNAWPSLLWHLFDRYLQPAAGYFGARKANEPLHVQYGYADGGAYVVNGTLAAAEGLHVTARALGLDASELWREEADVTVAANGVARALEVEAPAGVEGAWLLVLELTDGGGARVSDNVYALSTTPDVLDWEHHDWFVTPTKGYADLTALQSLPPVDLDVTASASVTDAAETVTITLTNPGDALAFLVRVAVTDEAGHEVLPVLVDDNYVTLLPGDQRTLSATLATAQVQGGLRATVSGWNVAERGVPVAGASPVVR